MLFGNDASLRATILQAPVDVAERPAPYVAAAAALALECVTHLVNYGAFGLGIRLLDSNAEWSYSHLLGTLAFAIGAVCGFAGATAVVRLRVAWWSICGLFAFLLVDNVTRFHEHVTLWPLIYAPVLLALTGGLAVVATGSDEAPVVYAGIALLFGSLAIHVFGPALVRAAGWAPDSWAYQIKVALKEGTELAGWVLLVPALARLARRTRRRRGSRALLRAVTS